MSGYMNMFIPIALEPKPVKEIKVIKDVMHILSLQIMTECHDQLS